MKKCTNLHYPTLCQYFVLQCFPPFCSIRCRTRTTDLTHFSPMFYFYTPWKRQKTFGFLRFPRGIEMEHWGKMSKLWTLAALEWLYYCYYYYYYYNYYYYNYYYYNYYYCYQIRENKIKLLGKLLTYAKQRGYLNTSAQTPMLIYFVNMDSIYLYIFIYGNKRVIFSY